MRAPLDSSVSLKLGSPRLEPWRTSSIGITMARSPSYANRSVSMTLHD